MKVTAVVPAAGKGRRLNSPIAKPLVNLCGRPIIIHTLKALSKNSAIKNIIVAFNKKDIKKLEATLRKFKIKKISKVIPGGETRRQSVENGLRYIDNDCDIVLIHDGARPFIDDKLINSSVRAASKFGASVVAVPVKSTIKEVNSNNLTIKRTLERNKLWEVQTPQVFARDLILKAYRKYTDNNATDDASLVEKLGVTVRVVEGSYKNIKITTQEDLLIAKNIIQGRQ